MCINVDSCVMKSTGEPCADTAAVVSISTTPFNIQYITPSTMFIQNLTQNERAFFLWDQTLLQFNVSQLLGVNFYVNETSGAGLCMGWQKGNVWYYEANCGEFSNNWQFVNGSISFSRNLSLHCPKSQENATTYIVFQCLREDLGCMLQFTAQTRLQLPSKSSSQSSTKPSSSSKVPSNRGNRFAVWNGQILVRTDSNLLVFLIVLCIILIILIALFVKRPV